MFWKLTKAGCDLAFGADAATAAYAVEINAELARSSQHRRSFGKGPAFAGRCENDQWVGIAHITCYLFAAERKLGVRCGKGKVSRGIIWCCCVQLALLARAEVAG